MVTSWSSNPWKDEKSSSSSGRGAKWRFSSQENLDLFREDPERYAPRYGGYCAYAMASGKKAKIDPEAFTIWEDRLYLNYSLSVQKKWREDIPGYVRRADMEWEALNTE